VPANDLVSDRKESTVRTLLDIVSKNGNLMLSVPLRGDGTFDEDEAAFLDALTAWMDVNGEGIFGTRPWTTYGEGPSTVEPQEAGQFGGARDVRRAPYTSQDVRFTRKGDTLYAYVFAWPEHGSVTLRSLVNPRGASGRVERVELLGAGALPFTVDAEGVHVRFPETTRGDHAFGLAIRGLKLS
jgi:alpha-L-fucosidase